jgi:hypothetical protein
MEKFVADVAQGRYKEEGWPAGPGYPTAPYWVSKIGACRGLCAMLGLCHETPLTHSRAHAGTNALTRVLARMEANNPNRYSLFALPPRV